MNYISEPFVAAVLLVQQGEEGSEAGKRRFALRGEKMWDSRLAWRWVRVVICG